MEQQGMTFREGVNEWQICTFAQNQGKKITEFVPGDSNAPRIRTFTTLPQINGAPGVRSKIKVCYCQGEDGRSYAEDIC